MPRRKTPSSDQFPGCFRYGGWALILVAVLISALNLYVLSQRALDGEEIGGWIFAGLIGVAGYGVVRFMDRMKREDRLLKRKQELYPHEPWRWDERWDDGVLTYSDTGERNFIWFFGIVWNTVLVLAVLDRGQLFWEAMKDNPLWVMALAVFPLIGLGTLWRGITLARRARRFGIATLTLEPFPPWPGGTLGGSLKAGMGERPEKGVDLILTCYHYETYRAELNPEEQHRTEERREVVWEYRHRVPAQELEATRAGLVIPIAFPLPEDAPESEPFHQSDRIEWRLRAETKGSGLQLQAEFPVPVYRRH